MSPPPRPLNRVVPRFTASLCASERFLDVFPGLAIRTDFDCGRLCYRRDNGARLTSLGDEDLFPSSDLAQNITRPVFKLFSGDGFHISSYLPTRAYAVSQPAISLQL
jgi:hypothetical protein